MVACACLGPQFGEPVCPCRMVAEKRERSAQWKEYHSEENTKKRDAELKKALSKVFGWENDDNIYH